MFHFAQTTLSDEFHLFLCLTNIETIAVKLATTTYNSTYNQHATPVRKHSHNLLAQIPFYISNCIIAQCNFNGLQYQPIEVRPKYTLQDVSNESVNFTMPAC